MSEEGSARTRTWLCHGTAAAIFIAAAAFLILSEDKGPGIFLVIVAIIVSRVLILNVASGRE